MDSRLRFRTGDDGQRWVLCELCIEWTPFENLAVDPADGLRWDVCAPCKQKEKGIDMSNDITLTESGDGLFLRAPYNADANSDYRKIGGKWKDEHRAWRFDVRDRDRIRDVLQSHFGRDDRPVLKSVTARVDLDEAASGRDREIRMFGRLIASRLHRDAEVRLGEGVILIDGSFASSGGSMKYPDIGDLEGVVLEVRDIPAGHVDLEDSGVEVIAKGNSADLATLEAERAQLLARLAEVDAAIEEAKAGA